MMFVAVVLAGWLFALNCLAAPLNPDTDPSRIRWTDLASQFGRAPDARGQRFGVVLKTPTNEYWRLMATGYRSRAAAVGIKLDIQAAQNEEDQSRQLSLFQNMVGSRYRAILISPITSDNLRPAIDMARSAKIPVIEVDGALADNVEHFVGPMNRNMGIRVAQWFIRHHPAGGKVAVIEGQAGVLSTIQRTAGFRDTLLQTGRFSVVASVAGNWDRQQASDAAREIAGRTPDLIGIYCNNDTMALGAIEGLKSIHKASSIDVFGSDGTSLAYASIKAGELAGTVDIFPAMVGAVGLEVAERVSAGQVLPRIIETPQILVTRDNVGRFGGSEDNRLRALLDDEKP